MNKKRYTRFDYLKVMFYHLYHRNYAIAWHILGHELLGNGAQFGAQDRAWFGFVKIYREE
jgi:hypothetical protein